MPANRANSVTVTLRNIAPQYGVPRFERLYVLFFGQQETPATFVQVGTDLRVMFTTPPLFPSDGVPVTFSFRYQDAEVYAVAVVGDGRTPFGMQCVDVGRPSVTAAAPKVGPARGGYFLAVGLYGETLENFPWISSDILFLFCFGVL
jgi:hypothetical protein